MRPLDPCDEAPDPAVIKIFGEGFFFDFPSPLFRNA
jgi:hypothetical protein